MVELRISADDTAKLIALEAQETAIAEALKRVERIGLPVADLKKRLAEISRTRKGLISEFGPGARPVV